MPDQAWKRGDTRPAVETTLNITIPGKTLETATAVMQHMSHKEQTLVITRAVTIVDAPTNRIRFTPTAGDMNVAGLYEVEWQVTDSDGGIYTIPNDPVAPFKEYEVIRDLA